MRPEKPASDHACEATLRKSKKDIAPATERDPKFFLRVFSATLALADRVGDLIGYKQG